MLWSNNTSFFAENKRITSCELKDQKPWNYGLARWVLNKIGNTFRLLEDDSLLVMKIVKYLRGTFLLYFIGGDMKKNG